MAYEHSNPVSEGLASWLKRHFSSPDALALSVMIVSIFLVLEFFGGILEPILVAVVLAYLLNALVVFLERCKLPHFLAVLVSFCLFVAGLVGALVFLLPVLWRQTMSFLHELPHIVGNMQTWALSFMQQHPEFFDAQQIQSFGNSLHAQLAHVGQLALSWSPALLSTGLTLVLYLILVPVLLLFILMDRDTLLAWCRQYLPQRRSLILAVWGDINLQIGGYIRGRVLEAAAVALIAYVVFILLGLHYPLMLGVAVGLGVIIPYVGAVLSTLPVVLVGLLQWGLGVHFWVMVALYSAMIVLDAYVLVPKLFSEILDLHPFAILVAVIVFGGLWGFWGVFFAIPLAGVVQSIIRLWPHSDQESALK
jgi:putative permease